MTWPSRQDAAPRRATTARRTRRDVSGRAPRTRAAGGEREARSRRDRDESGRDGSQDASRDRDDRRRTRRVARRIADDANRVERERSSAIDRNAEPMSRRSRTASSRTAVAAPPVAEEPPKPAAVSLWHKIFGSPAEQTAKLTNEPERADTSKSLRASRRFAETRGSGSPNDDSTLDAIDDVSQRIRSTDERRADSLTTMGESTIASAVGRAADAAARTRTRIAGGSRPSEQRGRASRRAREAAARPTTRATELDDRR